MSAVDVVTLVIAVAAFVAAAVTALAQRRAAQAAEKQTRAYVSVDDFTPLSPLGYEVRCRQTCAQDDRHRENANQSRTPNPHVSNPARSGPRKIGRNST